MNRTRNQSTISTSTRSGSDSDVAMYVLTTEVEENEQFFADQPLSDREIALQHEAYAPNSYTNKTAENFAGRFYCTLQSRGRNVFVIPAFRGPIFQHLSDLKCKLYGPPIVLQYLHKNTHLPRWSHPVFSETMRGAVVCFTGIDRNERTETARCIQWMSGAFTTDLNVHTTHLVALECDPKSEKYQKATEHRLPVLSIAWVDAAWTAAKENSEVSYVTNELVEKFALKLFDKLVMTVSGTSKEERVEISRLIEAHGGRFTGEMRSGLCTHLICDSTTGEKYRKARAWDNMFIVTKAWLIDCVEQGYRLSEQRYEPSRKLLLPSSKSNRPTRSSVSEAADARSSTPQPDAQSMPDPDFSAIPPYASGLGMSQMADATMNAESSTTAMASPTPVKARAVGARASSSRTSGKRLQDVSVAALDVFDTSTATTGDCLEGCRILAVGFSGARLDKIRKMINAVGGTRMNKFDSLVTHVIVGNEHLDRATSTALRDYSGAVVTAEWLVESYKKRRPQPPNAFAHPVWSRKNDIPEEDSRRSTNGNSTAHETIERDRVPADSVREVVHMDFTEIDEQALVDAADAFEARAATAAPVDAAVTEVDDEQDKFFANYTFRLTNFNEQVAEEICNRIIELGGTIVPDGSVTVNMLVCPLLDYEAAPMVAAHLKCEQIVTIAWLQICDEMSKFVDPDSNPVFRPIPADPNSELLKGCVITITGFLGVERSVYIEIARILGASFQETLSKNARDGLKATTHLVVRSTESEKYKRAVLWGLPVVDAGWLLQCMLSNRLVAWQRFAFQPDSVPLGAFGCRSDDHWRLSNASNARDSPVMATNHSAPLVEEEKVSESVATNFRNRKSVTSTADFGRLPASSTPVHARIESLRSGRKRSAPGGTPNGEPLIDTPSKFLDPDKPFKPAYNLKKARAFIDELDSPQSNNSFGFASVSQVGRVLEQAAIRMGQGINLDNIPSPITANESANHLDSARESFSERHQKIADSKQTPKDRTPEEDEQRRWSLKELGGVVLDSKDFDVSCSHLIAGSTFRNEKLLGSIASGKWVLQRSYLDASYKQGYFVNEADYEWGNEKLAVSFKDERTAKLAAACKRWRIRLTERGSTGAYDGWRCVLFVSSNKMAGMRRLLHSGGGQAWTRDEITSYDNITHALVDNCSAWRPSELDALIAAGVRCYRSDFIATYLMEEPIDDRASYWPEYRAAIDLTQK
uniref:BRCT domain-containing protein n=1 Tax=Plectus sambesii TaxID=2011161 RepID=A0A914UX32_9BILA